MMFFGIRRRLKLCEEQCENWRVNFLAARDQANQYKAGLFDSWKAMSGQTRGMQRMARKIKRLKVELADGLRQNRDLANALLTAKDDLDELRSQIKARS